MKLLSKNALWAVLFAIVPVYAAAAEGQDKSQKISAVVELFTSQGCSSCPPADALLKSYVDRPDVLALTFPVDYWDYLGWKDTLASPKYSQRQRQYAKTRGDGAVYTPQVVINGRAHAVGSRKKIIDKSIMAISRLSPMDAPIQVAQENGTFVINIGGQTAADDAVATVWIAVVEKAATVEIKRGENSGREITYYNVVRELSPVGMWAGKPKAIRLSPDAMNIAKSNACAILVQQGKGGPIIGAAWLEM
ncbi:MAG: DUF1223 domain-containing protein [Filomicrobium sp.]